MLERERRFWRQRAWYLRPPYLLAHALAGFGVFLVGARWMTGRAVEPEEVFPFALYFAFAAHCFTGGGAVSVVAGEVQGGALYLLGLAGMRARDLVMGQFACGLGVACWGVLGLVPWLWVGWLNSPLSLTELGWVALLWLLVGAALHSVLLFWASLGRTTGLGMVSGLVPVVFFFGREQMFDVFGAPAALAGTTWRWVGLYGGLIGVTVAALGLATWRLWLAERTPFRERGGVRARGGLRGWLLGGGRPTGERRRRLLDRNPVEWQGASRTPGWAWLLVLGGIGWGAWQVWQGEGISRLMTAGCATRAALLVLVSFQAYGQVRADLAEGTWEPLMRTGITPRQYLAGQWRAWWRQQWGPLAVIAVLPALLSWALHFGHGSWVPALRLLAAGVLLTTADAALAGIWFLGAALKMDGTRFYYAAVLSAGILGVMQLMHAFGDGGWGAWPVAWAVIASLLFGLSWKACRDDLVVELEEAAGKPDLRNRWFEVR